MNYTGLDLTLKGFDDRNLHSVYWVSGLFPLSRILNKTYFGNWMFLSTGEKMGRHLLVR
jgi:hypothetical protein